MNETDLLNEITGLKSDITTKMGGNTTALKALQTQVDAIDKKLAGGAPGAPGNIEAKTLLDVLQEEDSIARLMRDKRGRAVLTLSGDDIKLFERKTTITSDIVGTATTGVLQIQRLPGITPEARQQLTIRDLLTANPTTFQVVDFVKVVQPLAIASPVPEGSLKPENAVTFTSLSERVRTIATWIPASRQILDDMTELMSFLRSSLPYYTDLAEEQQLLTGDATGENLHGLIPQATAFDPSLITTPSWNKIDVIGRAIQQLTTSKELAPTFVVMNPLDWWDIRLTKDQYGHYILGDPQSSLATIGSGSIKPIGNLFSLSVDATVNISPGTFLIGNGSAVAAEIRDRLEMQIDISTEHQDFFIRNLVAVRAEKRLALIVRRPGSFIVGTFTTSP